MNFEGVPKVYSRKAQKKLRRQKVGCEEADRSISISSSSSSGGGRRNNKQQLGLIGFPAKARTVIEI